MEVSKLNVRSEDDAWDLFERAVRDAGDQNVQINFDGWPEFKLTLKGEDFRGTVPTRVMPPILELQKNIYRAYCQAKYHTDDIRCLKDEERAQLELIVEVHQGSTDFVVKLGQILSRIAETTHMTGPQLVTLVLGAGLLWTSHLGWKEWVASNERIHQQDVSVQMSAQETQRAKLLSDTTTKVADLAEVAVRMNDFRGEIARKLKPSDSIHGQAGEIISGERASQIVPPPRETSQEIRLDGEYHIDEVKFPKQFGGEYRFSVTSKDENDSFVVTAAPQLLTEDQIQILQESGFKVKTAFMQINAKKLRGNITQANLVDIKWLPVAKK